MSPKLYGAWPRCLQPGRSGPARAFAAVVAFLALVPSPLYAHDAFGDLGPFHASLLHPLADPLQAALLFGTAAFLAGRPLSVTRTALPVFVTAAMLAVGMVAAGVSLAASPILAACAALLVGLAAMLPGTWTPPVSAFVLVAVTGALTGLAPGPFEEAAKLQAFLGTTIGIPAFATLAWFALETAGRRLTPIIPRVLGSWVAAIGILVAAFSA